MGLFANKQVTISTSKKSGIKITPKPRPKTKSAAKASFIGRTSKKR